MPDFRELTALVRSRLPIIAIDTVEENKALVLLRRLADELGQPLFRWSAADGLAQLNFRYGASDLRDQGFVDGHRSQHGAPPSTREPQEIAETQVFQAALQHIEKRGKAGIYVLLDPHPYFGEAVSIRLLREIALDHAVLGRTLVLIAPGLSLPPELARHAANMRLRLPDLARVREMIKEEMQLWAEKNGQAVRGDQASANLLVQQLVGLCEDDVRRLIRGAVQDDGALTREDVERVVRIKQDLHGSGGLDVQLPQEGLDQLAGMRRLKRWLAHRRPVFTGEVSAPDLPMPRGMLLLGVQGAGKSAAAKAVAASWRVPLARLDIGSLFDKFQGETERKLREALQAAEALAPAVLWVDEIEKALASNGADSDGGLSRRILGYLLTWMAERKSRIFMVATANRVDDLPPELIRKGRFDEIFFVDLPSDEVRSEIFRMHLLRRGFAAEQFDLGALTAASVGFSGAEIEQAIVAARYEGLASGKGLDTATLLEEIAATRPLAVVMAEKVSALRAWALERCVSVD